jgi:hypothetical protein
MSVREEGSMARTAIRVASSATETHSALFESYMAYVESGPAFNTERLPKPEPLFDWYFTFGFGQVHQNCFHHIRASTRSEARQQMVDKFGAKWSMQYASEQWIDKDTGQTQQERFGLGEVK